VVRRKHTVTVSLYVLVVNQDRRHHRCKDGRRRRPSAGPAPSKSREGLTSGNRRIDRPPLVK